MGVNLEQLRLEILDCDASQRALKKCAREILAEHVEVLKKEFIESDITKEIEDGPDAFNDSNTLGGYGNLFSFIGFKKGTDPIQPILNLINQIDIGAKKSSNVRNSTVTFHVKIPDEQTFKSESKMPWESGRSWLYDMETRISGLGNYFFKQSNASRSGEAFQVKTEVRQDIFRPTKYFPTMLEKFIKSLK